MPKDNHSDSGKRPDLSKDEEGFTKMQRAFLEAYLGPAKYNATKAAKMAGYSEKTAHSIGHELKRKPHIRKALDEHSLEISEQIREAIREQWDPGW